MSSTDAHNPKYGDIRIAILDLRVNRDGRKTDYRLKGRNLGCQSVGDLFRALPKLVQDAFPRADQWNLFYTACKTKFVDQWGKRTFVSQNIIPFDFDHIDLGRTSEYIDVFCWATGLSRDVLAAIATGNGVHIIVELTDDFNQDYFTTHRGVYVALCHKIEEACKLKKLPIKVDTVVFSASRLLRLPGTINRKPGKRDTAAHFIFNNLKPVSFAMEKLVSITPASQVLGLHNSHKYAPELDSESVLGGCLYLTHCKDSAATLSEPQWYAMISILIWLDNGLALCQAYSKPFEGHSEQETARKAKQARENAGPRTCGQIDTLWDGCKNCRFYKKVVTPVMIRGPKFIRTKETGFRWVIVDKKGKGVPRGIAYDDLLKEYDQDIKHLSISGLQTVFRWGGKCWEEQHKEEIHQFVETAVVPRPSNRECVEFEKKLLRNNVHDEDFFTLDKEFRINCRNGVYLVDESRVAPHSPAYGFSYVLDYDALEDAQCPGWEEFLRSVTLDREELVGVLQEYLGYALSFCHPSLGDRALFIVGEGANGKSVFLDIVKKLLGAGNWISQPLRTLEIDANAKADLQFKMANILEEIGKFQVDVFRNFVSGGPVTGKIMYKGYTTFENKAKLFISCNKLPDARLYGHNFLRRLLIVPFDRTYTESEKNPFLRDELSHELPGILNWAMEGYQRLMKNGYRFSIGSVVKERIKEIASESSEPIIEYIRNFIYTGHPEVKDENVYISTGGLYKHWEQEAIRMRWPMYSHLKFSRLFLKGMRELHGSTYPVTRRRRAGDKLSRVWPYVRYRREGDCE